MTNTNCLQDIVCPQCGHTDSFIIEVKTRANVTDGGAETFGDMHWDERSFIECKNCQTGGTVDEFTREAPPSNLPEGSCKAGELSMRNTVTIVLDCGLVVGAYSTNSETRLIVLDLDIEGADEGDPHIYMDHVRIEGCPVESHEAMPDDDRKALEI